MARINIAKALKEKNRIAGELRELQALLNACNCYIEGKEQKFKPFEVMVQVTSCWEKLEDLKIKIQRANSGIVHLLVKMAETKAWITFLKNIPTTEGEVVQQRYINRGYDDDPMMPGKPGQIMKAEFDVVWVRDAIKVREAELNSIQDEVDAFNAGHTIEVDW